ncbi:MAG: phospho-sugar mutase [Micromonosporaceae bacterium]|nr:phospho-sugar mutase [Micromonosporaceae bacterium]
MNAVSGYVSHQKPKIDAGTVEAWIADDPDPAAQAELRDLLDRLPDTAAAAELADRFAGPLTFGTAGLRGPMRAGPNGMNLAVVRGAAAGLVRWLAGRGATGPLVIGFDARRGSAQFAAETARVATGAGRAALVLPRPLPTPVLAHAVRVLDAAAGVVVTASHNPPADNGYKVYLGEQLGGPAGAGAQIAPPVDAEIEAAIRSVGPLSAVPLGPPGTVLGEDPVTGYVAAAAGVVDPGSPKQLAIAYTPLHGVGGPVLAAALARAGFDPPAVVAEQAEPDPDFPTVAFPNPEEPGAMDRLLALAAETGADLALANDPDADRCAVAVPERGPGGGWRVLRGDELGVLLADHLIRRGVPGCYATTIVSSSLLRALCAAREVPYAETLTGFKWIVRAAEDLGYGYEEALGYCVAPGMVRDKDGITAALLVCELAAGLGAELRTLADRLDELAAEFGVYATDQLSVRVDDGSEIAAAMRRLRDSPPASLLDEPVTGVEDRADADVLVVRAGTTRLVVRPSGTEPKLKAYLEVVEPVAGPEDVPAARERARAALHALRTETTAALGLW